MVKAGVGLLVSLRERSVIQFYHLETLQYLQDINVASAITLTLNGLLSLSVAVTDIVFIGSFIHSFTHLLMKLIQSFH